MAVEFPNIRYRNNVVDCNIKLDRIARNINKAQFMLDTQIMNDMKPYMPLVTGDFIQRTAAESMAIAGTGVVVAGAAPYGRFLYEGKVMVGVGSGSAYAKRGEKKVVTNKPLDFDKSAHPKAVAKWFEAAKDNHGKSWLRLVNRIVGG